ncbi:GNAT family N-acetyltransferase [Flagellimonas meridianipacifica]|uniref:RimJ/RimL family protein N-acetyltransferase n=1 Tax=Flagellimonas meridianipacifica TaxID=1080225 RepID=A0A2T0M9B8_9FLAO|nr:GNAT family N-acetyltransferase [Allomuricauda pacifica]PRX54065.1 RimJ/RimL family protein N-acetyltransferase [Allomuricauda pacifica]
MVRLQSVTLDLVDVYIAVGLESYNQHYLHLWKKRDPTPYISKSFTTKILEKELEDDNVENFLVKVDETVIGVVKLIKDQALDTHEAKTSLLIQKIYLLSEFSGKGYGQELISLLETHAKKLEKKVIWLDTMQKGNALNFYLKNGFTIHKASRLELPHAVEEERPMWVLTKTL